MQPPSNSSQDSSSKPDLPAPPQRDRVHSLREHFRSPDWLEYRRAVQTEVYQLFREWLTLDPRDEIKMRAVHERARTLHALVGDDFKLRLLESLGEVHDAPPEPEVHPMAFDSEGMEQ